MDTISHYEKMLLKTDVLLLVLSFACNRVSGHFRVQFISFCVSKRNCLLFVLWKKDKKIITRIDLWMMNGINLLFSCLSQLICLSNIIRKNTCCFNFPFLYKKKQNLLQIVLCWLMFIERQCHEFFLSFFTNINMLQNIIEYLIIVSQWCIKTNIMKRKILYRWFEISFIVVHLDFEQANKLYTLVCRYNSNILFISSYFDRNYSSSLQ